MRCQEGRLVLNNDQVALGQGGDLAVAGDVLGQDHRHGLGVGVLDLERAQPGVAGEAIEAGVLAFEDQKGVAAHLGHVARSLCHGAHRFVGGHVVEVNRYAAG
jgi:hypothetical protein